MKEQRTQELSDQLKERRKRQDKEYRNLAIGSYFLYALDTLGPIAYASLKWHTLDQLPDFDLSVCDHIKGAYLTGSLALESIRAFFNLAEGVMGIGEGQETYALEGQNYGWLPLELALPVGFIVESIRGRLDGE